MNKFIIIFLIIGFGFESRIFSQIGADEIYAKYGKFEGARMLITTTNQYQLGKEMLIIITITNMGNETISVAADHPKEFNYGFLLYNTNGIPLMKSLDMIGSVLARAKEYNAVFSSFQHGYIHILPGQSMIETVNFAAWWKIATEGTYDLLVTRAISKKTEVLVSDKIRIKIVK